ncbi:MAG: oligosaccharide flippase family protein [Kamptonema sp. SIO4C4]|nr:oligosaccharide flippase family protein [Kamptonema sp. SIO4C4]
MLTLWQVQQKPIQYGILQVIQTSITVFFSLVFVIAWRMDWQGRIQAEVITAVIFTAISLLLLFRGGWFQFGFNSNYVRNALNFGIPLIPHTLGSLAIVTTDRILITNLVGIKDTGIYVVGSQIGMIILMIATSFNKAYVPWLYSQLKKNDFLIKKKVVKLTYFYYIVILLLAIILSLTSPLFLNFIVGKNFVDSKPFILWIALGSAFKGMYYMVTNYIFYVEKTHLLASVTFLTAIVNLASSYFLIHWNGSIGAAQGTMLAFMMSFLLTWFLSAKVYQMPWVKIFIN